MPGERTRGLRVLHSPTTVGGHAQGLARAERELGLASRSVVFTASNITASPDEAVLGERDGALRRELARFRLLLRALRDYDVVHFNYGSSFFPRYYPAAVTGSTDPIRRAFGLYARMLELRDLPILKRAGKAVFVTYLGDDARQADFCRARYEITQFKQPGLPHDNPGLDRRKRQWIASFDRYADGVYAVNPDLLQVLPKRAEFVPYASVDMRSEQPLIPSAGLERPVVVHAPSDRRTKGTQFVLDAVERLRQEGVPFEFRLIEDLRYDEARRLYRTADLLVDQLLAGWYGTLAVQAMALGKPVIAYLRDEDLDVLPDAMRAELPLIRATPSNVYETLRDWLTVRRGELAERGGRSRAFVERWHDPIVIAARMKAAYELALAGDRSKRRR